MKRRNILVRVVVNMIALCLFMTGCIVGILIGINIGSSQVKTIETIKYIERPAVITEELPIEEVEEIEEATAMMPELISLGTFEATAYCCENYPHICNDGDASTTATGTMPTVGRTIAVDPNVIPYGTEVIINGHTYIAEDCGGAIKQNRVDILFATHEEALDYGRQQVEIFVLRGNHNG